MRATISPAMLALLLVACNGDDDASDASASASATSTETASGTSSTSDPMTTGETTSSESSSSGGDTSSESTTADSSSDDASASSSEESSTGAGLCGGADVELIETAFAACEALPGHLGQLAMAEGVTCTQVCCVFGFEGCLHRAAQSGFECAAEIPDPVGACDDVFEGGAWSNHCVCAE